MGPEINVLCVRQRKKMAGEASKMTPQSKCDLSLF